MTSSSTGDVRRRRLLTPEMITALSAVFIGVSAIAVSLYQTVLIREQQRGSAWPHVEIGYSFDGESFSYFLANTGVGPARLGYALVRVDDRPVRDWQEYFQHLDVAVGRYVTSFIGRGVLAVQGRLEALVVPAAEPAAALYHNQHRVSLVVCYCSVYDDCWTRSPGEEAVPVRSCAPRPGDAFAN
jgi:hypothetical protein